MTININDLGKRTLIEVARIVLGKVGDSARKSKQEFLDELADADPEKVEAAIQQVLDSQEHQTQEPEEATDAPAATPVPAVASQETKTVVPISQAVASRAKRSAPDGDQTGAPSLGLKTVKSVFGIELQDSQGNPMAVEVFNGGDPNAIDKAFKFDPQILRLALCAIKRQIPVWAAGMPGTGKTQFFTQVAARLGRPFFRVPFDAALERYDMIGGERVRNGSTIYQDGIILQAIRTPNAIVLLDEVSFARPEYLSALHSLLERGGAITIPETGERIVPAEGVAFCAADNSNGSGDRSGAYAGIKRMNQAFLNRFGYFIAFKYLPEPAEARILRQVTGIGSEAAKILVNFASKCRIAVQAGELETAPSLRNLRAWAEALVDGAEPRLAFEVTIAGSAAEETLETLQQFYKQNIDETKLRATIGIIAEANVASGD